MGTSGIWDHSLWLPRNVTWESLKSTETVKYPSTDDLKTAVLIGAALLVLRILVESVVFVPIGWLFGWVKQSPVTRMITHLSGGFMGKSRLKKTSECGWRFIYYVAAWCAGLWVLQDQPQFYDVTACWKDWPVHPLPDKVYWYYMVETGFYFSLLFSTLFFDIRRHDFLQMVLHHAITILLLSISWTMNMVRIGTLVLFSHDAADIFIELAKLFRYARWQTALTITFVVLLIVWISSRLVYYPFWIIKSIVFDAPPLIQSDYAWGNITQHPIVPRVLMCMLCTLLILHIFWTSLLLNVAYRAACSNDEIDDIREDSESESEEDPIPEAKKDN